MFPVSLLRSHWESGVKNRVAGTRVNYIIIYNRQDKVTDFLLQAIHFIWHASLIPHLWIRTFAYISVLLLFHIPSTG